MPGTVIPHRSRDGTLVAHLALEDLPAADRRRLMRAALAECGAGVKKLQPRGHGDFVVEGAWQGVDMQPYSPAALVRLAVHRSIESPAGGHTLTISVGFRSRFATDGLGVGPRDGPLSGFQARGGHMNEQRFRDVVDALQSAGLLRLGHG